MRIVYEDLVCNCGASCSCVGCASPATLEQCSEGNSCKSITEEKQGL